MKLKDKVAIVTGGSSGIGRAIAIALASEGAGVVVNYSQDDKKAELTVAEINKLGGKAAAIKADISKLKEAERLVEETVKTFGRTDILINNAGTNRDRLLMIMSEEDWQAVVNLNLNGVFNCAKSVLRRMIAQKSGRIINISSVAGSKGLAGQTSYAATKAALEGFTRSLVKEVSRYNILVNNIAPGFIESERVEELPKEAKEQYKKLIPLERFGRPEEVAKVALFLASEEGSYVQGTTIVVDGGMTA